MPGSLVDANGNPVPNAEIGISPVPPAIVQDMLPAGILQHSFDITIQAPGGAVFTQPATLTVPNTLGLAPGATTYVLSFDHTTGRLVIAGTATVSADGSTITTDPGSGITAPGWHGFTEGGSPVELECPTLSLAMPGCSWMDYLPLIKDILGAGVGVTVLVFFPEAAALAALTRAALEINTLAGIADDLYTIYNDKQKSTDTFFSEISLDQELGDLLKQSNDVVGIFINLANIGKDLVQLSNMGCISLTNAVKNAIQNLPPLLGPVQPAAQNLAQKLIATASGISSGPSSVTSPQNGQNLTNLLQAIQQFGSALNGLINNINPIYQNLNPIISTTQQVLEQNFHQSENLDTIYYMATDSQTGDVIFSGSGSGTCPINFFAPPNTSIKIQAFDPVSQSYGATVISTPSSGQIYAAGGSSGPTATLLPTVNGCPIGLLLTPLSAWGFTDIGADGLPIEIDQVIGADPSVQYNFVAGISDLAALQEGLVSASSLVNTTGIIASLTLQGEARSVVLVGSVTNSAQQTAYVATGSYGLAIFDASNYQAPMVLGQIQLSGNATDVGVDSNLDIAAVATGTGGLQLIDVTDPTNPALIQTVAIDATAVQVFEGIAYANDGIKLDAIDLATDDILQSLSLGGATITGMALDGTTLYTMDASDTLRVIDLSSGTMVLDGSVMLPYGGNGIFVADGVAYVGAESVSTAGGYLAVDVSNPAAPQLIEGPDNRGIAGAALALNGSGLGVSVQQGLTGGGSLADILSVFNTSDPTNTGQFITQYNLPSQPYDVAIGSGIAFVADGTSGLQVVNYEAFDTTGIPPTVQITQLPTSVNPNSPEIQVYEGEDVTIGATVNSNVQVRNVELLVNGQVALNDVSYPFDLSAMMPTIAANGSDQVTLQVEAIDTGGNTTTSAPIQVQLVPDLTPLRLIGENISDGEIVPQSVQAFTFDFSKPLDPTTVTASSFQLLGPGGTVVTPTSVQLRVDNRQVEVTYPTLAVGSYQFVIEASQVNDGSGNPLGASPLTTDFTVQQFSDEWVGLGGGNWDDPANWSTGVVPGAQDRVLIDLAPGLHVTVSGNSDTVGSILFNGGGALALSGGTLDLVGTLTLSGGSSLVLGGGGTLAGGTLAGSASYVMAAGQSGTLQGVTIAAGSVFTGQNNSATFVVGPITNDGTVALASTGQNTDLVIVGNTTLAGSGTVQLGNSSTNRIYARDGTDTLTVAAGQTIEGSGQLGAGIMGLDNQGVIDADQSNQLVLNMRVSDTLVNEAGAVLEASNGATLLVQQGGPFTNAGTVEALAGSTVNLQANTTNTGTLEADDGTLMVSAGTLTDNATLDAVNGGVLAIDGGTLALSGTLSLSPSGAGLVLSNGGTIDGGTLAGSASYVMAAGQSGTLQGVTIAAGSVFTGQNNSATFVVGPITNDGTVALASTGQNTDLVIVGNTTLAGSGTVQLGNSSTNRIYARDGTDTLTVAAGQTIEGSGQLGAGIMGLDNQGVIDADQSNQLVLNMRVSDTLVNEAGAVLEASNGATLLVQQGGPFTNAGTVEALAGSTVNLQANTTNTGTLEADDGTLMVSAGTLTDNATLDAVNGGVLAIDGGTLALSGTLSLSPSGAGLVLSNGGTIDGGTLAGSASYVMAAGQSGTLQGVTIAAGSVFTGQNNSATFVVGPITNDGTVALASTGQNTDLVIVGNTTLAGSGTVQLGNSSTNRIYARDGTDTLTVAAGQTIEGSGQLGAGIMGLDNQGVIDADQSNQLVLNMRVSDTLVNEAGAVLEASNGATLLVQQGGPFTNAGTVEALAGSTVNLQANTTNTGTLEADDGTLMVSAGTLTDNATFDAVNGGVLAIDGGTLALSGTLSLSPSGAGLVLSNGGTIDGGTLAGSASYVMAAGQSGTLQGVTIAAGSVFTGQNNSATFVVGPITNDGTVALASTGQNTDLVIVGNTTLAGSGTVQLGNSSTNRIYARDGTDTLTVAAGQTIEGSGQLGAGIMGLDNQGVIDADQSNQLVLNMRVSDTLVNEAGAVLEASNGATLLVQQGGPFTNAGTVEALAGSTVNLQANTTNTGTLEADDGMLMVSAGTLTDNATLDAVNGGVLAIDGGTLALSGTLSLSPSGAGLVLSNGGTIDGGTLAGSASYVMAAGQSGTLQGVTIAAGSVFTGQNNSATFVVGPITNDGTVALASTGQNTDLVIVGNTTLAGSGTVQLGNSSTNRIYARDGTDTLTVAAGQTIEGSGQLGAGIMGLDNQGVIDADQSNQLVLNMRVSDTLVNEAGAVLEASNGATLLVQQGGPFTNAGTVEALAGSTVNLQANTTNTGTLEADDGTLMVSAGTLTDNATLDAVNGGVLAIDGGTLALSGTLSLSPSGAGLVLSNGGTIDGGTLAGSASYVMAAGQSGTLQGVTIAAGSVFTGQNNSATFVVGPITNDGTVALASTGQNTDLVIVGNTTLAGSGTVQLGNSSTNRIYARDGTDTLTVAAGQTIEGSGQLGAGIMGLDNQGVIDADQSNQLVLNMRVSDTLVNEAGAVLEASNGATLLVQQGGPFTNAGTVEALAGSTVNLQANTTNTGTLWADGGNLDVMAAVAGTGTDEVTGSATLEFGAAVASGQAVSLDAGSTGTLRLDSSQSFAGTVAGLSQNGSNFLDLSDISFGATTQASYSGTISGGTLQVTDGTHTADISLLGNYTASTFVTATDNHGGTLVHDPVASLALLVQAAASFAPGPGLGDTPAPLMPPPASTSALLVTHPV